MTDAPSRTSSTPARLIVAGLIAPFPFIALVIVQGILQPDYSHVVQPISALAALPLGWLQNINFYIVGTLMTAYAIGLHFALRQAGAAVGPALIALSGGGLILCAVFPWRQENGVFIEPVGHVVGAVTSFLGASIGHMVVSRGMRRDPQWKGIALYVLASGITMLLLFFAVAYSLEPGSPLRPWTGALQRVLVAIWLACTFVVALRGSRVRANTTGRADTVEASG